jgi:2-isopropylmalate synthase
MVGRRQQIDVGPMSGKSNVVFWLEQHGLTADEDLVERVFRRAKSSPTVLTEGEMLAEIAESKKFEGRSTKVS